MERWSNESVSAFIPPILQYSNTPALQFCSFLLVPFENHPVHDAANLEQSVFVMHHLFAGEPGDGVILAKKNGLFRANFLAHAAKNAPDHVDIELLRIFLDFGETIGRWDFSRNDFDGAWRANKFTKLTSDATHPAVRIVHQGGRPTIMFRH